MRNYKTRERSKIPRSGDRKFFEMPADPHSDPEETVADKDQTAKSNDNIAGLSESSETPATEGMQIQA